MLSDTLWRALTFPITYLLIFVLVVTALMQIRYVNRALQRFDSTQVIPVQFVLFTISVIIGSAVLYRDFQSANADRFGKFFGGCALTFLGVYLITSGRAGGGGEEDLGDTVDEENAIDLVDEERYQDEVDYVEEANPTRRKSSVSVVFDQAVKAHSLRRSSTQQTDYSATAPQTPLPLLSHTSSTSSRTTTRSESTASPLLHNPWQSDDSLVRPQARGNVASAPALPPDARESNPSTPVRPTSLSRRSMARLTPGPLMSPLSSSLSAVVADSLRKGVDASVARRRPRISLAQTSSSRRGARSSSGDITVTDSTPLKATHVPDEGADTNSPSKMGRPRSLSVSLGELFRVKRARNGKSSDGAEDDTHQ